jgi:hypothetical protein
MSDSTEIYICQPGQGLKEGKLEYSNRVHNREEAECDAEQRCRLDPSIDRIAYYSVDEAGKFRNFYTHKNSSTNSRAAAVPKQRGRAGGAARPASVSVRRPGRNPTLLQKIRAVFEVD